jgi:hypothetical protein
LEPDSPDGWHPKGPLDDLQGCDWDQRNVGRATRTLLGTSFPVAFSNMLRAPSVIFSLTLRSLPGSTLPWPNFFSTASRPVAIGLVSCVFIRCEQQNDSKTHPCRGNPLAGRCQRHLAVCCSC